MAELPRFLATLGMTSYNPAVQTSLDETLAQLQHLSLSFRTQRSGVRNLKSMFSKRRFAACTAPTTMAERSRFLAMLGTTIYRPAAQTSPDGRRPG